MEMNRSISGGMASLLAADAGTLAPVVNPIKIGLIVEPFTPTADMVRGDIVLSADVGLVPIAGVVGPQNESVDPVTGENIIELKEPLGGWRWETPEDFIGPVTIYGYALVNNADNALFATEAANPPVQLIAANQAHNAGPFTLKFDVSKVH